MRPGRGFGVILDAEHREIAMAQAFEGVVVQVDVSHFDFILFSESGSTQKP